jgi:hypothetical protein
MEIAPSAEEVFRSVVQLPIRHRGNGRPVGKPYVWRGDTATPEAAVRSRVAEARRRARAVIVREIEAGRWWVPRGFTVADLDALIAEVYG